MSGVTDDKYDPRLNKYRGKGHDKTPVPQQDVYLVLSEVDRKKGFLRPYRTSYRHKECNAVTTMGVDLSETYASDPWFYSGTYCVHCAMHRPLSEFIWEPEGESLDPNLWPESLLNEVVEIRNKHSK